MESLAIVRCTRPREILLILLVTAGCVLSLKVNMPRFHSVYALDQSCSLSCSGFKTDAACIQSAARACFCVRAAAVTDGTLCPLRYDRSKLQLKEIHNVQYVSCMNPTAGSFTINPRLQVHAQNCELNTSLPSASYWLLSLSCLVFNQTLDKNSTTLVVHFRGISLYLLSRSPEWTP